MDNLEVNPNHPVTQFMRDQWAKIAALIMWKLKVEKVTIESEEFEQFNCLPDASMPTIVVHMHGKSVEVMLMPLDQATKYAQAHKEAGGQAAG